MTTAPGVRRLPVDYEAGRFLLRVPLANGRVARLLVDTCGGFVLARAVASGLPTEPTGFPDYPDRLDLTLDPPVFSGRSFALLTDDVVSGDGVLSAGWFADRCWVFDYRDRTLALIRTPPGTGVSVPIALAGADRDSPGAFPSVEVVVDDEPLRLLLDTGATGRFTEPALAALGESGPALRASSFLESSVIRGWWDRHPDWPVIDHPTALAERMIRADRVRLGPLELGPVWFESRRDDTFHLRMTDLVGSRVDGALGGAPFHDRHRLVIDFRSARLFVD